MTLTEIRLCLEKLGVRPSRRLGQNFLYDQNVARRIVELAEIKRDESVLEIGPGLGALTKWIVKKTDHLILIEKDSRFISYLQSHFSEVQIVEGDALHKISDFGFRISDFVVLGNLPYSIASPIIVRLCEADLLPKRMFFTIQLEVAERLKARPCTHDFGLLTLLTQPFYEIKIIRKVPASVFWPKPEVTSAVVEMRRRPTSPFVKPSNEWVFREITKKAFQKRRKTLGAIFKKDLPEFINPKHRPEELSVDQWVHFAEAMKNLPVSEAEVFDVVDYHDKVISQEQRSEVHRKDLRHRAVHIFIWNKQGELLLQKRSSQKDVAPNKWDSSASGHLQVGEEYDAAAGREVAEELGAELPLKRIRKFEACKELGWEFVWLYEGESEGPFYFPKNEISKLQWWKISKINDTIEQQPHKFAQSFCYLWKASSYLEAVAR